MKTALFTICCANYLPRAAVLLESLVACGAQADLHLVLAEDPALAPAFTPPAGARLLTVDALGIPNLRHMAFQYNVTEFNTALKPWAFQHLFDAGYEAVVYFDPDIRFYADPAPLFDEFQHADLLLTPHITRPCADDGVFPTVLDCLRAGQFNLGFLGARNTPQVRDFIAWWRDRLERHCLQEPGYTWFVDQLWAAQGPSFVDRSAVLRGDGLNVAYWNLFQRGVRQEGARFVSGDEPLMFFHFSGFDPARPGVLSRYSRKGSPVEPGSALARLLDGYREALAEAEGRYPFSGLPYTFGRFASGEAVSAEDRRRFLNLPQERRRSVGDPFAAPPFQTAVLEQSASESAGAPAVAFLLMGGRGWQAGLTHLRNLIRALRLAEPASRAEVLALCGPGQGPGPLERARLEVQLGAPLKAAPTVQALHAQLERGGYDLLFAPEQPFLHQRLSVPWVAFLHDFQHFRMPRFFSEQERAARCAAFTRAARLADLVAVSSRDSLADLRAFLPAAADKALVLPPAPWPGPDIETLAEPPGAVAARLGLPPRYLLLPSQGWAHKDHLTALEALARCPAHICLALTGRLEDGRNPGHAHLLRERMAPLERQGRVRALGLLDGPDALQLMRGACAVVLPSLFEGFGLAVAEAEALGKRVLLSDIAAHREHAVQGAQYFAPGDAQALADLMRAAWEADEPDFDPEREALGLALAREKALAAGRAMLGAVQAGRGAKAARLLPTPEQLEADGLTLDAAVERASADAPRLCDSIRHAAATGRAEALVRLAQALLERGPTEGDGGAEQFYLVGLAALNAGAPQGRAILGQVAQGGPGAGPQIGAELQAWACFKLGELQAAEDQQAARALLLKALRLHPGHAKARLALQPPGVPPRLAVNLPATDQACIRCDFNPLDETLWEYHLGPQGRAASLHVGGLAHLSHGDAPLLAAIIAARTAPGGKALLAVPSGPARDALALALLAQGASVATEGPALSATFGPIGGLKTP